MSAFKTSLFAIVMTIATLIFASLTFAKDPPKSPFPPRPKPGHGQSLTNEQVANPQLLNGVNELGTSGGFTITHGGNPPRGGDSGFTITHGGNPPRGGDSGFTITHGGNPPRAPGSDDFCHEPCRRNFCDRNDGSCCGETFEPLHSACMVFPGDTFESISLREYRSNLNARSIASFNKLPWNVVLVPGRILMLPVIGANKVLSPSHAPVATSLQVAVEN